MRLKRAISIIAVIELLIGASTVLGVTTTYLLHLSEKSPTVFIFVLSSAIASTAIGLGLLKHKKWARTLLVFFSGYIVITKVLIFSGLMNFNGEIITFISAGLKNYISIVYHICVVLFFTQHKVKKQFNER
ncbi:MAG: hypothetical protein NTZ95_07625 [Candidatus Omnitrophica bacterium]|nr:hypothetical protein [Candidatus Omnitrophota bacterium]